MAAAQVFIALWAASLAVAAPQGTELRSVKDTSINQDQVVSQVVDFLGPAVSKAVADALTSLNQANSVVAARAVSNAATKSAADLVKDNITAEPTARPVYNFEYKVADDTAQTYISLNEVRDGSDLTGEYSYVDVNGGLVTVNYLAGPRGYSETREVQDGFVEITAKPTKSKVEVDAVAAARAEAKKLEAAKLEAAKLDAARLEASEQEADRLETARLEVSRLEAAGVEAVRLEAARLEAARLEAEQESAFIDQSSLIDQVLAILQPLISNTVQEAISTSSSPSTSSSSTSLSSSSISDSSLSTGDVSSTFGTNSLSVSVETPEFQFAF